MNTPIATSATRSRADSRAIDTTWDFDLRDVAWIGQPREPARGIALFLHGKDDVGPKTEVRPWQQRVMDEGICFAYPYYGPWGWMTPERATFLDDFVDKLRAELGGDLPLVTLGGSMGGQAVLMHSIYSRHAIRACSVNCPVCDLGACFDQLPDVRRSMIVSLWGREPTLRAALERHSPISRVDEFPDIPYQFIHHVNDEIVPKSVHSDKLVPALRRRGIAVDYVEIEAGGHCAPLTDGEVDRRIAFLLEAIAGQAGAARGGPERVAAPPALASE